MPRWFRNPFRRAVTLREQLSKLSEVGICLSLDTNEHDLLQKFPEEFYQVDPYKRLLPVLGEGLSDDVLMLDTECIDGNGSYASVLQPMVAMTRGALPVTDWKESLEDADDAWVQFRLRGRTQRWSVIVNGDWIDASILGRMGDLLEHQDTELRYVFHSPGGQTALIACCAPDTLRHLNELTGMSFKPLRSPE